MARVVVIGLASDFGCQVQMTNMEDDLLDVLGLIELSYWQLASSGHMPSEYDVAVIEGAVTTVDHVELLKQVRDKASTVIVIGACAIGGGIPALATGDLDERVGVVYREGGALVACGRISPIPVDQVIEVDYHVPGCPIQPQEFVATLQRALMGLSNRPPEEPLCAACKMAENLCFYDTGQVCLGVVTRTGCGAKCVSLGRPCTGCRGVAGDASLEAAKDLLIRRGHEVADLTDALSLYNSLSEALQ